MEKSTKLNNINNNKEKESTSTYLIPILYIKRALIRIWKFLLTGLHYGFNCIYIFYFIYNI